MGTAKNKRAEYDNWRNAEKMIKKEVDRAIANLELRVLLEWESEELASKDGTPKWIVNTEQSPMSGNFGEVRIFMSDGNQVAAKISMHTDPNNAERELRAELNYLQKVQTRIVLDPHGNLVKVDAPHANIVKVHGIASIPYGCSTRKALIMDAVPGPTGRAAFDALRKSWETGILSSAEYWSAIQFITRRLLEVTTHLAKARVVHCDLSPSNILINKQTGEPVLIDFGLSASTGQRAPGGAFGFSSPEQWNRAVDQCTDVFMVGSTITEAVQGETTECNPPHRPIAPNNGPMRVPVRVKDAQGEWVTGGNTISSDYEKAIRGLMDAEKRHNPDLEKLIKDFRFLRDSMLDDDQARAAIKKAIKAATEESKKPVEERWKKKELPCPTEGGPGRVPTLQQLDDEAEALLEVATWDKELIALLIEGPKSQAENHASSRVDMSGINRIEVRPGQPDSIAQLNAALEDLVPTSTLKVFQASANHYLRKFNILVNPMAPPKLYNAVKFLTRMVERALDLRMNPVGPTDLLAHKRALESSYEPIAERIRTGATPYGEWTVPR